MLEIVTLALGPTLTNTYLVADEETSSAVVIDPAWDGQIIVNEANKRHWNINQIWLTHAHFDHIGGVAEVVKGIEPEPPVALHPDDLWLWEAKGFAEAFGLQIEAGPEPRIELSNRKKLLLGKLEFEVLHAPGHTPGHVMFYCEAEGVLFSGDVIFQYGIGRTDFPRGDYHGLINSIKTQVLTLPDETRIFSGHGPETKVGVEWRSNPFIA
jgi:glyoxylase-like metal-dependent hydrolase (beta-lactamase superfamily II)